MTYEGYRAFTRRFWKDHSKSVYQLILPKAYCQVNTESNICTKPFSHTQGSRSGLFWLCQLLKHKTNASYLSDSVGLPLMLLLCWVLLPRPCFSCNLQKLFSGKVKDSWIESTEYYTISLRWNSIYFLKPTTAATPVVDKTWQKAL